jgi:hypothetical protein
VNSFNVISLALDGIGTALAGDTGDTFPVAFVALSAEIPSTVYTSTD